LELYQTGRWIPREYLLLLLSHHERDELRRELEEIEKAKVDDPPVREAFSGLSLKAYPGELKHFLVNLMTGQVFETNEDAVVLINMIDSQIPLSQMVETFPGLTAVA
jgi:hypothetical protein